MTYDMRNITTVLCQGTVPSAGPRMPSRPLALVALAALAPVACLAPLTPLAPAARRPRLRGPGAGGPAASSSAPALASASASASAGAGPPAPAASVDEPPPARLEIEPAYLAAAYPYPEEDPRRKALLQELERWNNSGGRRQREMAPGAPGGDGRARARRGQGPRGVAAQAPAGRALLDSAPLLRPRPCATTPSWGPRRHEDLAQRRRRGHPGPRPRGARGCPTSASTRSRSEAPPWGAASPAGSRGPGCRRRARAARTRSPSTCTRATPRCPSPTPAPRPGASTSTPSTAWSRPAGPRSAPARPELGRQKPGVWGRLALRLDVTPEGRVREARQVDSTFPEADAVACVRAQALGPRAARSPRPPAATPGSSSRCAGSPSPAETSPSRRPRRGLPMPRPAVRRGFSSLSSCSSAWPVAASPTPTTPRGWPPSARPSTRIARSRSTARAPRISRPTTCPTSSTAENGGAPYEALKAQAIAARSYLLYYKIETSGSINDGQSNQVYSWRRPHGGANSGRQRDRRPGAPLQEHHHRRLLRRRRQAEPALMQGGHQQHHEHREVRHLQRGPLGLERPRRRWAGSTQAIIATAAACRSGVRAASPPPEPPAPSSSSTTGPISRSSRPRAPAPAPPTATATASPTAKIIAQEQERRPEGHR